MVSPIEKGRYCNIKSASDSSQYKSKQVLVWWPDWYHTEINSKDDDWNWPSVSSVAPFTCSSKSFFYGLRSFALFPLATCRCSPTFFISSFKKVSKRSLSGSWINMNNILPWPQRQNAKNTRYQKTWVRQCEKSKCTHRPIQPLVGPVILASFSSL